jgi:8-oxo-dGTP pyrophosphatase MutT (NUDIX family)
MTSRDVPTLVKREAVRGILLTPDARVLLIEVENPSTGQRLWITPGGGIEPGESHPEALARELREETGFVLDGGGTRVWIRRHVDHEWNGRRVDYTEHFYLVETAEFTPSAEGNPEAGEVAAQHGFRWWTVEEIVAADRTFAPRRLGELLGDLLAGDRPDPPRRIGA